MDGVGVLSIPSYLVNYLDAGRFVGEGQPIPMRKFLFSPGVQLEPRKIGVITSYTREMAVSSNLEAIVRTILNQAAALALDHYLFDNVAGDAIRPPGLLNGVTPITPTAGGGTAAMIADISAVVGAVAASGGRDPCLFGSVSQITKLSLLAPPKFDLPVFASSAIPDKTLIAVDAAGFVTGFQPIPQFDASQETAIHEEDTTPLPIGTPGTPATVAAPTRSLWQTDVIALRMKLFCAWAMRAPGLVQQVANTTW